MSDLLLRRRKEYVIMRALGIKMAQLWGLVLATAAVVDVAMGPAVAIATRSLHWANPVELLREV